MEVNALQQMLSRLRQVQEDLQRQVNTVAVEASAGGGMVTVKMNGQKQVLDRDVLVLELLCLFLGVGDELVEARRHVHAFGRTAGAGDALGRV